VEGVGTGKGKGVRTQGNWRNTGHGDTGTTGTPILGPEQMRHRGSNGKAGQGELSETGKDSKERKKCLGRFHVRGLTGGKGLSTTGWGRPGQ